MGIIEGWRLNTCKQLGLLIFVVSLTGCRTNALLFTSSGPGWRIQEGQVVWRFSRQSPELSGELLLVTDAGGRSQLQFLKTPVPIVLAQSSLTSWIIQFPPRQMSFGGQNPPPERFIWLYLYPALHGETLPQNLRFSRNVDAGWKLENEKTGEMLEGFLTP